MEGGELPEATCPGRRTSAEEAVEGLFEKHCIPYEDRGEFYDAIARSMSERQPRGSWLSNTSSTASSALSSKRSTQASFASSCTNYSSLSTSEQQLPAVVEEPPRYSQLPVSPPGIKKSTSGLHRRLQKHFSPQTSSSSSRAPSSTPDLTENQHALLSKDSRRRWCPWCQHSFSRPNDFSRHVTKYCCGSQVFVCRNQDCRNRMSQEGHANKHRKESDELACRNLGWTKIELQCKRLHFGCGYCAGYFNDLEKYIEHFSGTCRPDKVRGHWQQSRQIKALLQQPLLLPIVERLCLQLRGTTDAYRALWWTWKTHRMDSVIRRLEYGTKPKVDDRHPGLADDSVVGFLTNLIQPSSGSQLASEIVPNPYLEKQLPPVPEPTQEIDMQMMYDPHDSVQMDSDPTYEYMQPLSQNQTVSNQPSRYDQWHPQPHVPQPQAYPEVTLQQQLESGFTLPTPMAQGPVTGDMQYSWSNMTIDDSNEAFVDTSWIPQELGYDSHQWR